MVAGVGGGVSGERDSKGLGGVVDDVDDDTFAVTIVLAEIKGAEGVSTLEGWKGRGRKADG